MDRINAIEGILLVNFNYIPTTTTSQRMEQSSVSTKSRRDHYHNQLQSFCVNNNIHICNAQEIRLGSDNLSFLASRSSFFFMDLILLFICVFSNVVGLQYFTRELWARGSRNKIINEARELQRTK
eukprot:PhF_6_TR15105/c2_g1_i1/m.23785